MKEHKGVRYFGYSDAEIEEAIAKREYNASIFYRSMVYSYSCIARVIESGRVEFVERFDNGASTKTTMFDSKEAFYARGNKELKSK